jgi:hypothetical protein
MVRVLLISSASIGPLFISALLKKEGHIVRRLYQDIENMWQRFRHTSFPK